jgi:probable metal-binding protein
MNNVVHAHILMDFMQENPHLTTIAEVKSEFERNIGQVFFTNCTNQIYSFDEIVDFLFKRNKINYHKNTVEVNAENRCKDE